MDVTLVEYIAMKHGLYARSFSKYQRHVDDIKMALNPRDCAIGLKMLNTVLVNDIFNDAGLPGLAEEIRKIDLQLYPITRPHIPFIEEVKKL